MLPACPSRLYSYRRCFRRSTARIMTSNIAMQKMSPDEARLFRLYGKLPNKKDLLQNKLKVNSTLETHRLSSLTATPQERKYFDSGDYALSKAGKASDIGVTAIGREHPVPEKIPHIAPPAHNSQNGQTQTQNHNGQEKGLTAGSKEHTFLHRETSLNRETSAEDFERDEHKEETAQA
jgi:hypothetical protein